MVSPPLLPVTRSPSRTDGQTRTDGRTVTVGPPRWRKDGQPVTDGSQRTAAGGLPQSPRPRPGARPGSLPQDPAAVTVPPARAALPGPCTAFKLGASRQSRWPGVRVRVVHIQAFKASPSGCYHDTSTTEITFSLPVRLSHPGPFLSPSPPLSF